MNATIAKLQLALLAGLLALALDGTSAAGPPDDGIAQGALRGGSAPGLLVPPSGGLSIIDRAALHAQRRTDPLGLAPGHDGIGLVAGPDALPLQAPDGEIRTMGAGPVARTPRARADRG